MSHSIARNASAIVSIEKRINGLSPAARAVLAAPTGACARR
jgi:hypothetical protein